MKKIEIYGKGKGLFALIDDEDYAKISQYRWHLHEGGYAITKPRIGKTKPTVRMHRLIMGVNEGQIVDHIDRNPLNNQKLNLRLCTKSQNAWNSPETVRNTSGFKGVRWSKKDKNWRAEISKDGSRIYLGSFKDKKEAAYVWDQVAIQLHGRFAYTNLLRGACR